jgi:hypothetical protein
VRYKEQIRWAFFPILTPLVSSPYSKEEVVHYFLFDFIVMLDQKGPEIIFLLNSTFLVSFYLGREAWIIKLSVHQPI